MCRTSTTTRARAPLLSGPPTSTDISTGIHDQLRLPTTHVAHELDLAHLVRVRVRVRVRVKVRVRARVKVRVRARVRARARVKVRMSVS